MKHRFAHLVNGHPDQSLTLSALLGELQYVHDFEMPEEAVLPPPVTLESTETLAAHIQLPEGYEPTYNYPTILWLSPDMDRLGDIEMILPQISDRNYVGIGVAPLTTPLNGVTGEITPAAIQTLLEGIRTTHSIHSDRIYLVGEGAMGTQAFQLFLQCPNLFAGLVCLNGDFPGMKSPLRNFRSLQGKRVLLSTRTSGRKQPLADLIDQSRTLYTAGTKVATRVYQKTDGETTSRMLRDIDHWIMNSIESAIR